MKEKKNAPSGFSKKAPTGKLCAKCGNLRTGSGYAICSKGHEHFNAEKCSDYDDRSSPSSYPFGGVTGIIPRSSIS